MAKKEKFSCPHCGLRYDVRPDWAGQNAKCKCCRNVFTIPGTPPADVDPRCNATAPANEDQPLPEASIVDNTSSVPETSLPEAKVIVNAEAVPFLDPIDEPEAAPAQEVYQTAPSIASVASNPFAESDPLPGDAAPGTLKPLQQPRRIAPESSTSAGSPDILGYFLSRPLACLLFLTTMAYLVWAHTTTSPLAGPVPIFSVWFTSLYYCFLVYLGFRHDRGKSWDEVLIKIWLVLVIVGFALAVVGFVLVLFVSVMLAKGDTSAGAIIIAFALFLVILAVQAGFVYIWYLLLQRFGFFRPNAFIAVVGLVFSLVVLSTISIPQHGKSNKVARDDPVVRHDQGFQGSNHGIKFDPDSFNVGDSPEAQLAKQIVEQQVKDSQKDANRHNTESPAANENPFGMPTSVSAGDNPFETTADSAETPTNPFEPVEDPPVSENPFEPSDTAPANENPFETPGAASVNENPFAVPSDLPNENPFEPSDDNPFEGNSNETPDSSPSPQSEEDSNLSSVGTVSIDLILDRLNSGSTSGVKRLLKSLSRHRPVDGKREAVSHTMISLLENDRLTFVHREIIDILAAWMTPKVSDDLVKVMKASNDYNSTQLIKQLAQIPDDKVAAAVVKLWAKKPLFLREAVVTLGPRAEEPLWTVLESSDKQLKIEACQFLAQQGTQKSIIKLAKLAYAKGEDRAVAEAAENAMKALNTKEKE